MVEKYVKNWDVQGTIMKGAIREEKERCLWQPAQEFVVWEHLSDVPLYTQSAVPSTQSQGTDTLQGFFSGNTNNKR